MTTVALIGDVMLGRGVNAALRTLRPEQPWGDVLPLLVSADLRIINLECALTDHEQPWTRTPKVFHFRADYSAIEVLRAAHVDCCSLANNHTLDFEERGLLDTLEHLKAAGIRYAGAGLDREEAAREAGADTVVFSNHWGPNMVQRPSVLFRQFAHAVIDRGADVYYGHSAHIFQGVEIYRGKPILYDTGDFIDDYAVDPRLRNDRSFLFRISLEESEFRRLELFPVALSYARAQLAKGSERESILDQMERLSGEMGTTFVRREGRLVFATYI